MKRAKFAICIDNSAYPVSLEKHKLYRVLPDPDAEKSGHLKVIDESGEAYLLPAACFIEAELSDETERAVLKSA